jgi:transcriptional regulator with XRE-family HTH domain
MRNNLKKIRKQKQVSQLSLAYLTRISPSDISRIENGWVKPYPGWRKRLAEALGVTEDQLFPNGKEM